MSPQSELQSELLSSTSLLRAPSPFTPIFIPCILLCRPTRCARARTCRQSLMRHSCPCLSPSPRTASYLYARIRHRKVRRGSHPTSPGATERGLLHKLRKPICSCKCARAGCSLLREDHADQVYNAGNATRCERTY
jgi:hypothetical protein